jgi:hypothetical protein
MKNRLHDAFGDDIPYEVIGEPMDLAGARMLAKEDPYQFQWWALGKVHARPADQKKGSDKGIDGRLVFFDGKTVKDIVISVKAGKTSVAHVRDLRGVIEREKAEIGVLITMEQSTREMRKEAASARFYTSQWGQHPRLQLLTIEEILSGKGIDYPRTAGTNVTFKKGPRAKNNESTEAINLFGESSTQARKSRQRR